MGIVVNLEQSGLRISIWGALFFAVLGISFSVATNCQAVLLDGAFNLITAIMGFFAIRITRLLEKPASQQQPVGYVALEPLYVLTKGLILLVLTTFVFVSNVLIMLRGGSDLKLGVIIIYISLAVIGNFSIYLLLKGRQKKVNSPMLAVESENWLVNALISTGIGISFLLVFLFRDGFMKQVVPYVDQIVVMLVSVLTISVPIKAIRCGMRELLLMGPDEGLIKEINEVAEATIDSSKVKGWNLAVVKTGRKIWVSLFVNPSDEKTDSGLSDFLQEQLSSDLAKNFPSNQVDVIITRNLN